jgi:hypothetical protein
MRSSHRILGLPLSRLRQRRLLVPETDLAPGIAWLAWLPSVGLFVRLFRRHVVRARFIDRSVAAHWWLSSTDTGVSRAVGGCP